MRISDGSSDVCSSDLFTATPIAAFIAARRPRASPSTIVPSSWLRRRWAVLMRSSKSSVKGGRRGGEKRPPPLRLGLRPPGAHRDCGIGGKPFAAFEGGYDPADLRFRAGDSPGKAAAAFKDRLQLPNRVVDAKTLGGTAHTASQHLKPVLRSEEHTSELQ